MNTQSSFEILPHERGKTWKVPKTFTKTDPETGKSLTVPEGYEHDRATGGPDTEDDEPFASHDRMYDNSKKGSRRRWDDGTRITRLAADKFMRYLMEQSKDPKNRFLAETYYEIVRKVGWAPWLRGTIRYGLRDLVEWIKS
jgi:hypothetical protein